MPKTLSQSPDQSNQSFLARLLADFRSPVDHPVAHVRRWLDETLSFCDAVAVLSSTPELRCLFWVRLFGVVNDIDDSFRAGRDAHLAVHEEYGDPNEQVLGELATGIVEDIRKLAECFSEDEQVFLYYRRQVEAHPFQSFIRLRRARNGRFIDPSIFGRTYTIEATKEAIRGVRARHGDDASIAASFAARARPLLVKVRESIEEYFGVQE